MAEKRLGIFLFYDKDGVADRYIEYMLKDIRPCLDRLIVIANGKADENAVKMFESIADKVVIRENKGFDIGAWQQGITEICGREELAKYDSLTLFNDSFFGPFYPFADIYKEMESRSKDYWGLSVHGEANGSGLCPYGYRPRYIQTYFMVFEKDLLHSEDFFSFWEKLPEFKSYNELAEKFVAVMTMHFSDLGYEWDVLCDTSDLEGERSKNFDQHTFNIYELVANRRFPIIKRRSFHTDRAVYLQYSNGSELFRALEYIEKNYDYDISLIFEHLLRLYEPETLKNTLCLDYVLPDIGSTELKKGESAVIAHLVYDDMFERYGHYLKNIPAETDIIITTNTPEKEARLKELYGDIASVRLVTNRGRDMSALLVGCRDILMKYEFLCFVHDKKSSQKEFASVGAEFDRLNWENILHSEGYIRNIIGLFKAHSYLGMLSPFGVDHGSYFYSSVDYWTVCYDVSCALAQRIGIKAPAKDKQPLAIGTCFWCRASAMRALFENDFTYEDFPAEPADGDGTFSHAVERLLPYAAANKGCVTGWVYNTEYARTELTNLRYMTDSTAKALSKYSTVSFANFRSYISSLGKLSGSSATQLSMGERANKAKKKNELRLKLRNMTPEFALKIYRRIKYR